MSKSVYNLEHQNSHLPSKITVALEKISEAYRIMLWDEAKKYKLSPIQIQLIVFIQSHREEYNTVSYLSKEFNITKATISDSVKTLESKGIVQKITNHNDSRSFSLELTKVGVELQSKLLHYSSNMLDPITFLNQTEQQKLWAVLSALIENLNSTGIVNMQRMCYSCSYFNSKDGVNHCNLLEKVLTPIDIRIDCPEHKTA